MTNRKARGYQAENIALQYYEGAGWTLIQKNFTIPGGEIDLIIRKSGILSFVEVKDVSYVDDLCDYITPMKHKYIKRTINVFLKKLSGYVYTQQYIHYTRLRCDVVFIKKGQVYTAIEDCVDF